MTTSVDELAGLIGADASDRTSLEACLSFGRSFVQGELTGGSPSSQSAHLDRAERVEHFSGGRGRRLIAFAQPVNVSLVELEDTWLGGASFSALAAADWEVRGRQLIRGGGLEWPSGSQNIRVTSTRGYDQTNPMPWDLRQAIYDVAALAFRNRLTIRPTIVTEDGISLEMKSKIPAAVWSTIRRYRIPEWC